MHPFTDLIFALATRWPNPNACSSVLEQRTVRTRGTQISCRPAATRRLYAFAEQRKVQDWITNTLTLRLLSVQISPPEVESLLPVRSAKSGSAHNRDITVPRAGFAED
jgi:hypothetical protein